MDRNTFQRITIYLATIVLLFGSGWYARGWWHSPGDRNATRRIMAQGFRFTSPLLDVELPEGLNIRREPIPFKYKIESFIKERIRAGRAKQVAVYYRDLHDGPWFGINSTIEFNPASMMKVPVMIAWLKRAEKDPAVLKRRMKYEASNDPVPEQYTKPALALEPGQSYSIEELLRYMMNYSDNKATSLLYKASSNKELGEVLDNMDINNNPNEEGNFLTVHGYSGFFRILYNASYLNREMSEKALQLLSLQDFPLGISAGVPEGIKVAAKFGEIVPANKNEDVQLHEFGVIYHPKNHYILGIMTRGHDFAHQAEVIRDISKLIYSEVDSSMRN